MDPGKTEISLNVYPVRQESSLCTEFEDNCIQNYHLGRYIADIWSEINFDDDTIAEL